MNKILLIYARINYVAIYSADMVFSAPFYLQNLLDKDRFPDYPIRAPDEFLSSLMLVRCALSGLSFLDRTSCTL